jgi:hypothetical protein
VNKVSDTPRRWRWPALACALALLNASLTFRNVWPTPAVEWTGALSIELAVCVLGLALATRLVGTPPRWATHALAAVWVLLVVGRYADVTAPAIYGREINLYWDVRHLGAVVSMMASALSPWTILAVVAALVVMSTAAHRFLRWAIGCVAEAMHHPRERRVLTTVAALACLMFVGQRAINGAPALPEFSTPVTESYARQARLFTAAGGSDATIPAARPLRADLSGLGGADVFVIFVESYGAVAYDQPSVAGALAVGRARLQDAIDDTGRRAVSAFVTSPTFGGSSWLAHVSLLTGVEVRNEDTNVRVMAQHRDTMVTAFSRAGYRTVAAMPGNSHPWPEGAFYGFDDIYDRARLDYRGPRFGWWPVPDQFTLARLDQLEIARLDRPPVFTVMPTISTHAPFGPTAPYQRDWTRVLGEQPYGEAEVAAALATKPDLLNMGPSYVNAVTYTYASLAGYLRLRANRDFVVIVLGDHQPAAAVSGEGARWDVPVHVIAGRPAILDRLQAHGFVAGLTPQPAAIAPMHTLLDTFLQAFGPAAEPPGLHAD